jgi:hypothetical protein
MVAELARRSFSGDNQMKYGLTYVFLLLMLITIFSQLHFLAIALSFFDALYVVPVRIHTMYHHPFHYHLFIVLIIVTSIV